MIIQGAVRVPSLSASASNVNLDILQGKAGDVIIAELHGKYFTQTYNGNTFIGSTTNAGVAIPADNATAMTFGVWNPVGSNKLLVPVHYRAGIVTLGTRVVSSLGLAFVLNCGSGIATGSPITAFTETTPRNALIGGGVISGMKFGLAATITAVTNYLWMGLYHDLAGGGSAPPLVVDFDGTLALLPGNAMFVISADAATGSTYAQSLIWTEVAL